MLLDELEVLVGVASKPSLAKSEEPWTSLINRRKNMLVLFSGVVVAVDRSHAIHNFVHLIQRRHGVILGLELQFDLCVDELVIFFSVL